MIVAGIDCVDFRHRNFREEHGQLVSATRHSEGLSSGMAGWDCSKNHDHGDGADVPIELVRCYFQARIRSKMVERDDESRKGEYCGNVGHDSFAGVLLVVVGKS